MQFGPPAHVDPKEFADRVAELHRDGVPKYNASKIARLELSAAADRAKADELMAEQIAARGEIQTPAGKVRGPYEPTPENEARAREILRLRRRAARMV